MPDESALSVADRLRAALDRTEEIARAATPGPWRRSWPTAPNTSVVSPDRTVVASAAGPGGSWPSPEDAAHFVANDPATALRSVAAHRKILDAYVNSLEREAHWKKERIEKFIAWSDHEVTALRYAVEALASIYFPEETTDGP